VHFMLDFIVQNLPILLCLLISTALMILEVFMPGFGIAGISGITLSIVGVWLTWRSMGPLAALGVLLIMLALMAIVLSIGLRSTARGLLSKSSMVLNEQLDTTQGFSSNVDLNLFIGKQGTALTPLRPAGLAEIEGVRLNVVSNGDFIPKDTSVVIASVEGTRIVVTSL